MRKKKASEAKTKAADKVKEVKEKSDFNKKSQQKRKCLLLQSNINKADAEHYKNFLVSVRKKHKRLLITVTKWAKSKVLPSFLILMVSVKLQLKKLRHS